MSEKSYWRERPAAHAVHLERVRGESRKNMELLANGISFVAVLMAVFGVCMLNFELMLTSAVMAYLSKKLA